jgi:hypothetical protein
VTLEAFDINHDESRETTDLTEILIVKDIGIYIDFKNRKQKVSEIVYH